MGEGFGFAFPGRAEAERAAAEPTLAVLTADRPSSVKFDAGRHVFIEGDNLDVLKLLAPAYGGRVQMIYIDPPYNRGRDFVYRGVWSQAKGLGGPGPRPPRDAEARRSAPWMAMMLPRLLLAKTLLRDDGTIFVSIDDHEAHHLRVLLDEVFGREHFLGQIVVVSNRGGRDYLRIAATHEYVLCYGRSPAAKIFEVPRPEGVLPHDDGRGPYELRELRNRNPRFTPANRPNLHYPIWVDLQVADATGAHPVSLEPGPGWLEVVPRNREGSSSVWRWGRPKVAGAIVLGDPDASEVVARRRRDGGYNIYEKHRKQTTKPRTVWDDPKMRSEQGSIELRARLGDPWFDHPKPIELVRRCVEIGCGAEGIVLDFFAGSGTTLEAVLRQNEADGGRRRCVLVQRAEAVPPQSLAGRAGCTSIADITRERLRRAVGEGAEGLRCFRVGVEVGGTDDGDWGAALGGGAVLDGG